MTDSPKPRLKVPRVTVETPDGENREVPLTISRAHEVLTAKARQDFNIFFQYVYAHRPGQHQRTWLEKSLQHNKVMIACPRGFGKTDWALAFMAWYIGHNPWHSNVIASVSGDVARQRLAFLKNIIEFNPKYKSVFPWITPDHRKPWTQKAVNIVVTNTPKDPKNPNTKDYISMRYVDFIQKRITLGVEKTHTVLAASPDMNTLIGNRISGIALIDDLHDQKHIHSSELRRKAWEFYESTYINCLVPSSKSIIIGTRWANDDIIGRLLEIEAGYHFVDIPAEITSMVDTVDENGNIIQKMERIATFPELFPLSRLDEIKNGITDLRYQADYLNRISTGEYSRFDLAKLQYNIPFPLPEFEKIIISVDPAYTTNRDSDYTAIVTIGIDNNRNIYLLELKRERLTPERISHEVERSWYNTMNKYGMCNSIIVEGSGYQFILGDKLASDTSLPIEQVKYKWNKETKATLLQSHVAHDKFYADWDAPWGITLKDEMIEFPNGRHDDMVDAIAQACNYLLVTQLKPLKSKLRILTV